MAVGAEAFVCIASTAPCKWKAGAS